MEKMKEIQKAREEVFGPDENDEDEPTALANSGLTERLELDEEDVEDDDWGGLSQEELIGDDELPFIPQENTTPTIEEENQNFEQTETEAIPFDVAVDNEPEIEITNTTVNDFGSMVPTNEVEEEVVNNTPQFITREVVDDVVIPEPEVSVIIDENDLKPFDVDVTTQPEPNDKPMFEVRTDLGGESLSEKKNF